MFKGKDLYVVGSGPSSFHIHPDFLKGKLAIGVHNAHSRFPFLPFYLRKRREDVEKDLVKFGDSTILFLSSHRDGDLTEPSNFDSNGGTREFDSKDEMAENVLEFSHPNLPPKLTKSYLESIEKGQTAVGVSDAISAMHLGAKGGAKSIVLIGMESGFLNSKLDRWLTRFTKEQICGISEDLLVMKRWLKSTYGIPVHSMSPFINFALEGHSYKRLPKSLSPSSPESSPSNPSEASSRSPPSESKPKSPSSQSKGKKESS